MQESIRQLACQIDVGLYPAEVKVIPTKVNVLSKLEKNAVCREKNFKKNLKFNLEEPREMKKKELSVLIFAHGGTRSSSFRGIEKSQAGKLILFL